MTNSEVQEEIDKMEKALEEPDAGVGDFRTDAPGTEDPGTTAPGTAAPSTEAPDTESPSTDVSQEDPRDAELRKLREDFEEMKKGTKTTDAPPTKAPSTEVPVSEEDFLGNIDLDDLTRDPKAFNQLLNKVYKRGRESTRGEMRATTESIIRSIPDITRNVVATQAQLAEVNRAFYEENKDLLPWKKSVAAVFEELIAESPDKRYDELLPKVATEVRKRIGLQKSAGTSDKDNPPLLPKKKSGNRQSSKPDLSKLDQEMEDMDKALGFD